MPPGVKTRTRIGDSGGVLAPELFLIILTIIIIIIIILMIITISIIKLTLLQ